MAKASPTKTPVNAPAAASVTSAAAKPATDARKPSHEEIARKAYEIFEASGRKPGRETENWLKAEAELAAKKPRA